MFTILFIIFFLILTIIVFLQQPKFGRQPTGERLEKIKRSPNYKNGTFQNLSITPDLTDGATYASVMKEFFFERKSRIKPVDKIPSKKTDLLNLDENADVLVWFGHSSYFIQLDGKRILVDPVFSGSASPLSFTTKAFKGTDVYTADEIPVIDYLFISHDHWDHLDYQTIKKLKTKIRKVICGLGTGEHFEYWGFDKNCIIEKDWNEKIDLDPGFTAYTVPARHFSGRSLTRNKALWTSFVLQTPSMKIFIGGDSGYDTHFDKIGKEFGSFDLAILENGQYDKSWKHIHLMPNEILKVARELNAKRIFPVHSSKFSLANHAWDEPLKNVVQLGNAENISIITPLIGEQVNLKDPAQQFSAWWENVN